MQETYTPIEILRGIFGYHQFRMVQEEVIDHLCSGGSGLVLMPTGGGKSLCYQIPSLIRPGMGLVISPLIALMDDQVGALKEKGIAAEFLNSSLSHSKQDKIQERILKGEVDLLYVSPERLANSYFQNMLSKVPLSVIAIDEAHCVSKWGHDFRPEYSQIGNFLRTRPQTPVLALTATADMETKKEIVSQLGLGKAKVFQESFERKNIFYQVEKKKEAKDKLLKYLEEYAQGDCTIVYCLSRKKVDQITELLEDEGYLAVGYHAGMGVKAREKALQTFLNEEEVIVVATVAFGMGIDRADVRHVIHMDMPKTLEGYYQETGRAGRDGKQSHALMFFSKQEMVTYRKMMRRLPHSRQVVEMEKLELMLSYAQGVGCRTEMLLENFSETFQGPCGHCDNCASTKKSAKDATELSILAMGAIHYSGQRLKVEECCDFLLGLVTLKMRELGLFENELFGTGDQFDEKFWKGIYRQLSLQGLVEDESGILRLCEKSLPVLKGEVKVMMDESVLKKTPPKKERKKSYSKRETSAPRPQRKKVTKKKVAKKVGRRSEGSLYEILKEERLKISKQKRIPAFKVFHDRALLEMAENRPSSLEEFTELYGIGKSKTQKYGKRFLKVIIENS